MSVRILKGKEGVRHVNSHFQQSDDANTCAVAQNGLNQDYLDDNEKLTRSRAIDYRTLGLQ